MALTIRKPSGKAAQSNITPTGAQNGHLYGPPASGAAFSRGVYIREVGGVNGTYRWLYDESTPGVASPSPSTWTYAPF